MANILRLNILAPDFEVSLSKLLAWDEATDEKITVIVQEILATVKQKGDSALVGYTNQLDRRKVSGFDQLIVTPRQIEDAFSRVSADKLHALEVAAERIRSYHGHQKLSSWHYTEADGSMLGQKITPLDKVGIYVPGGKASYPSSVLMNAIPARVAGVGEIVMTVPSPDGELNDLVLAAARIAGVDKVFTIGGAQAIAALAYGTESIPKVDKIVGPGNIFVATAKRLVFGQVGLDMIAGPSEILILCDGKTNPDWIAMDLFSQAEHDENAQSILVSDDPAFLDQVQASINKLLPGMQRSEIIRQSLEHRGALILVPDMQSAIGLSNRIAPEHLELSVANPEVIAEKITHAGAIFMGRYTAEALGDYCAGPNHVLPTSGTARFSSPLGVYDFQKRSSLINCSPQAASKLGLVAATLARGESLEAHARSAEYRITKES